jgi:3-dehydroquinate synthase
VVTIHVPIREQRDASYDILIGGALLAQLPALVARHCPAARYAVITDSQVAALYGEQTVSRLRDGGLAAERFEFPAGEWNKTRHAWASLSDQMLAAQFGRDCAVIALGGGVVGDVAGFVAATYLRGVRYVQVPTTLLAMIDSSIGGKTGVDVPAGKNLLGAFHQPRLVVVDPEVLASLPRAQLIAGMAEAVKHGVIADAEYFAFLEASHGRALARDPAAIDRLVTRSIEIKAAVVADDERELGRRAILNFGHTVGHAVEATTKYTLLHGEAVAIGMAYEARLAEALTIAAPGTAQRIRSLLERVGLPLERPAGAGVEDLLLAMRLDKKARAATVRFALPQTVGTMCGDEQRGWTVAAPEQTLREVLASTP